MGSIKIRLNQMAKFVFYKHYLKVSIGPRVFKIEASYEDAINQLKIIHATLIEELYYDVPLQEYVIVEPIIRLGAFISDDNRYADAISFHQLTINPSKFHPNISSSEVTELLNKRHKRLNHKTTSIDEPFSYLETRRTRREELNKNILKKQNILELMRVAYGAIRLDRNNHVHRTVASAGALYPLTLFYVDLRLRQLYEFDGVHLTSLKDLKQEDMSFISAASKFTNITDWTGIILVFASLEDIAKKYGPKAYSFCLIEAGEVLQNITHYIEKNNFSQLIVGCVRDSDALAIVDLSSDSNIYVIGTLIR